VGLPRSSPPAGSASAAIVAIVVAATTVLCRGRGGETSAAWRRAVDDAEAPLEAAIRRFDAAVAEGDRAAAPRARTRRGGGREGRARRRVESIAAPPALAASQREELVFLNHVIPGFERFARSEGGATDAAELRSILQRGRAHQRSARSPEG
jgi:hypothetical protein